MNTQRRQGVIAAILITVFVGSATTALADWSHDPLQNDLIMSDAAINAFNVQAVADGAGGVLVAYVESVGAASSIRVQRVDSAGNPMWGSLGVVGHQGFGYLIGFTMIADGAGGAFLAIQDSDDALYYHAYVQHITGTGTLWGSQGLDAVPPVAAEQSYSVMCLDGNGGVIVAFSDFRNGGGYDLYGQRFDAAGNRQWTSSGKPLCSETGDQYLASIAFDGASGFYLAWEDYRNFGTSSADIYSNHFDLAGDWLWSVGGFGTVAEPGDQLGPKIIADAQGGAIVAWYDGRAFVTSGYDVYAQRFRSDGAVLWGFSGRIICDEPSDQAYVELVPDGVGGAFMAWRDSRSDSYTGNTIYVQGVSAGGLSRWTSGGVPAGGGNGGQDVVQLALTSDDNCAVVWRDYRTGEADVYTQMFSYSGAKLGGYYGQALSSAPFIQKFPKVVADDRGGYITAFEDFRNTYSSIFIQRMDRVGVLGDPAATITRLIDHPLDQGGQMLLDWSQSWLDEYQGPGLYRYSAWRRFPGSSSLPALAPLSRDKGLTEVDLVALQQAGWNYIDEVSPQQFAEYGLVVPTFADSTGAGSPVTEYMVLTESSNGNIESNIVGGWSVDNLAPGAPLALAAELVGADASLAWSSSGYHDEDLLQYNLYRAQAPGVVPGPLTFVASSPDTVATDPALPSGDWYYVVTAVDVHGNEGEPSNEVMVLSASAVTESGIPQATVIRGAYPNPFNPTTNIRFGVPTTGKVRLTVYDLRGQKVATLADQVMTAGYHTEGWQGRDEQGRPVPSGIYFAKLEAAGAQATSKLVLTK